MGCGIEPQKIRYRRGREVLRFARRQHVRHRFAKGAVALPGSKATSRAKGFVSGTLGISSLTHWSTEIPRMRPDELQSKNSRTWRMIVLSAGIRSLLWDTKEAVLSRPTEALAVPGEIIPEWWATSSRDGWAKLSRNGWAASFRNHGRLAPKSAGYSGGPRSTIPSTTVSCPNGGALLLPWVGHRSCRAPRTRLSHQN